MNDYKLTSGVVAIEILAASSKHPNELQVKGVLVRLDEPSTKAPHGSSGHKILIPKDVAASKIDTLINMPINYHDALDRHNPNRPVGIIKAAKIIGDEIVVEGIVWKKNFPDAEKDLSASSLGMSFEACDVQIADTGADVWKVSNICFTGATILYKSAAAYFKTSAKSLAASGAPKVIDLPFTLVANASKGAKMPKNKITKKLAKPTLKVPAKTGKKIVKASEEQQLSAMLASALGLAMQPVVSGLAELNQRFEVLASSFEQEEEEIEASEDDDDEDEIDASGEDDEEEEEEISAAKDKKKSKSKSDDSDDSDDEDDEEDDDIDAGASDDEDELEDMDDGDGDDDDTTPGHFNPPANVKNKGRKVTVSDSKKAGKKMKVKASSAVRDEEIEMLSRRVRRQAQTIRGLRELTASQTEAISAASASTDRRSISASALTAATLAKGDLNVADMHAEGSKLNVADIDRLAAMNGLDSTQSMAMKTELARLGVMD